MPFPQTRYLRGGAGGPVSFLLRQVITKGYVLAGYRNSSPWTSVNEVTHSTDTTIDLGSPLNNSTAYPGGMADDTFAYVLKANNTVGGSSSQTNRYNMRTNVSNVGPPIILFTRVTKSLGFRNMILAVISNCSANCVFNQTFIPSVCVTM